MKPKWLDRRIARPAPYLCLCLGEDEYKAVMRGSGLDAADYGRWLNAGADATTHFFQKDRQSIAVVCLRASNHNAIEIAGLLVHEAVHVWQEYCQDMGEKFPGSEQEAYAIQAISQELMAEYARRLL